VKAVDVKALEKRFGETVALEPATFSVDEGELFGLIGPDGAGKTTLFRMLATLVLPTAGQATVDGLDVVDDYRELRNRLGYMPGKFALYQDLTVAENLDFFASIFGTTIESNYEMIRDIYGQLEPFRKRRAGALSGGMKQKLALSCALIHRPRVLLLDEPTTGVDAVSRLEFWDVLTRLRDSGLTILVSTPYMDEAARCDRVALIQNGRILEINTPGGIEDSYPLPLLSVKTADRLQAKRALERFPFAHSVFPFGEELHFTDSRSESSVSEIKGWLGQEGVVNAEVAVIRAGIEDVFMHRMLAVESEVPAA
jgi:ABC-2 type transport system ATP-binding protein